MMSCLPDSYHFLLEPIQTDMPCGDDLEYDPKYMELFIRLIPKEKKTIGGSVGSERLESECEPIRWAEVEHECLELLARSRDVRLFMVLLRCRVQQAQATGLRQGLYLLEHALRTWPESIYPLLTEDGEPDPLPRADALMSLTENQGLLADIRRLSLNGSGGLRLEVREVERSFSMPVPEGALPPEAMRHRLEELASRRPQDYLALTDALALARAVDALAHAQLGADAPDLDPLLSLLARLEIPKTAYDIPPDMDETAVAEQTPRSDTSPPYVDTRATAANPAGALPVPTAYAPLPPPVRIANRHIAREQIREIRLWFEEYEPSSPVCLLLRQAEQMIGKRFTDLVHSLPDELLQKWDAEYDS